MMLKEYEVKVIKQACVCETCGIGEYDFSSVVITMGTPYYEHKCTSCGDTVILDKKFPSILYKRL